MRDKKKKKKKWPRLPGCSIALSLLSRRDKRLSNSSRIVAMTTLLFVAIETFSPFVIGSDLAPIATDCSKFDPGFASRDVVKTMDVNTRNDRTIERERRLILSHGKKILFFLEGRDDSRSLESLSKSESLSRDRLIDLLALLSLYFASFLARSSGLCAR